MTIGPGSSRLWKMDDAFDDIVKEYVDTFRDHNINVINLVDIYASMTRRDTIHFSHTPKVASKMVALMERELRVAHTISHCRASLRDLLETQTHHGSPDDARSPTERASFFTQKVDDDHLAESEHLSSVQLTKQVVDNEDLKIRATRIANSDKEDPGLPNSDTILEPDYGRNDDQIASLGWPRQRHQLDCRALGGVGRDACHSPNASRKRSP